MPVHARRGSRKAAPSSRYQEPPVTLPSAPDPRPQFVDRRSEQQREALQFQLRDEIVEEIGIAQRALAGDRGAERSLIISID